MIDYEPDQNAYCSIGLTLATDQNFEKNAYIDAYGDTGLNIDKSSTSHFIIVSISIESEDASRLEGQLDELAVKFFSSNEIKSARVGGNVERRLEILAYLDETVPYKFGSLIIDKRDILHTGGLIYKKSFIKFCHDILLTHLFSAFPSIRVLIDEHGSPEFMAEFGRYVRKNHLKPNLFTNYSLEFVSSESSRALQLADFIAGSLARIFDPKKRISQAEEIWNLLRQHILWFDNWPPQYRRSDWHSEEGREYDQDILEQATRSVIDFIQTRQDSHDMASAAQVETANYLYYVCHYDDKHKYVSTAAIQEILKETRGIVFDSDEPFWHQVIQPLRDAGVLIVSNRKGYKLPISIHDLREFVIEVDHRITPQVKRLQIMRDIIRTATLGRIDILSDHGHLETLLNELIGKEDNLFSTNVTEVLRPKRNRSS